MSVKTLQKPDGELKSKKCDFLPSQIKRQIKNSAFFWQLNFANNINVQIKGGKSFYFSANNLASFGGPIRRGLWGMRLLRVQKKTETRNLDDQDELGLKIIEY